MGLTTSMYTGLTGLNSNQFRIDTIGNNVANVNTTAFKGSRANFQNQFSLILSEGSGPGPTTGGTNPSQVGLGSMLGSVQRNFLPGAIETTGLPTDVAVEGAGFFVVRDAGGEQAYTRDGSFKLSSEQMLVTADGFHVQGFGIDDDFNVVPGPLQNIEIPLGTLSTARATEQAILDGNLNADGAVATQGTILTSQVFRTGAGAGPPATAATLLTDLYAETMGGPLFAAGDVLTLDGAVKGANGGRQLPEAQFTVAADSTLGDYATFLENELAINTDPEAPGNAGVWIGTAGDAAGRIIIEGNAGTENALALDAADITSTNPSFAAPFLFTEQQEATGESVFTSFIAYDSLGNPVQVNLTAVMDGKDNQGIRWRFYAESPDDTRASSVLGPTGTLQFNTDGMLSSAEGDQLLLEREATGAIDPLSITLDFSNVTGLSAAYSAQPSTLVMTTQNGYSAGTLSDFSVSDDGVIHGTFSNGLVRPLGQLALATFANSEGLISDVNNLYRVGPNSGQPIITAPQTLGAGGILSGALELSNIDLTREFIGLVTATMGFSASGRVISTSNELLNELMRIAR